MWSYFQHGEVLPLALLALISCGVALSIAAKEDWKSSTVSGIICVICWAIIALSLFLWGFGILHVCICIIMCLAFYILGPESPAGSADLLPLAMYIATYAQDNFLSPVPLMYPLCILVILVPYAKVYGKVSGSGWKIFRMQRMPMLPCLAIAWWLSVISYVIYKVLS